MIGIKSKFPFCIQLQPGNRVSQMEWCDENVGPCFERWDYSVSYTGTRFYFRTKDDMVWFALRWA